MACGTDEKSFEDIDTQTDSILTALEQRPTLVEKQVQLVGEYNDGELQQGQVVIDLHVAGSYVRWLSEEGKAYRQDLSTIKYVISDTTQALGEQDNRAQKRTTKWVTAQQYNAIVEPIDLTGGQFLMLHSRDPKQ